MNEENHCYEYIMAERVNGILLFLRGCNLNFYVKNQGYSPKILKLGHTDSIRSFDDLFISIPKDLK